MSFAAAFPGQGSQSPGMLNELAGRCPEVAATFAEASSVLGFDLARLVGEGPAEELDRTENTQPALLAAGVAVWRAWRAQGGPLPAALAGHSLGEYSALVAAEALDFADAVKLVRLRGKYMQEAVPAGVGAMAAILGLDARAVGELCVAAQDEGLAAPANLNAPAQTVIAGHVEAVDRVAELAREAGAKRVVMLPVSVPSHCVLMEPAAEALAAALASVRLLPPALPVVNNVDVAAPTTPAEIADALIRQLTHPVRWTETIEALHSTYHVNSVIEFGPGKVISGLVRRTDPELKALAVYDFAGLATALEAMRDATRQD